MYPESVVCPVAAIPVCMRDLSGCGLTEEGPGVGVTNPPPTRGAHQVIKCRISLVYIELLLLCGRASPYLS